MIPAVRSYAVLFCFIKKNKQVGFGSVWKLVERKVKEEKMFKRETMNKVCFFCLVWFLEKNKRK